MKRFTLLAIIFSLGTIFNPAFAYFSRGKVTASNTEFLNELSILNFSHSWNMHILDNEEVTIKSEKDYHIDQYCHVTAKINEETQLIDINSVEITKSNSNPDFNMEVIKFLKNSLFQFKYKNPKKPIKFKFKYWSF